MRPGDMVVPTSDTVFCVASAGRGHELFAWAKGTPGLVISAVRMREHTLSTRTVSLAALVGARLVWVQAPLACFALAAAP